VGKNLINKLLIYMELIGKTSISPIVFYTGKISGFVVWIILLISLLGFELLEKQDIYQNHLVATILFIIGFALSILSILNLGKSTRLGIPSEDTSLKTNGLYQFSRNPIYVGFNLITTASIIYTLNWVIAILGIYSLITYHLIIKGEEKFLISRFGEDYTAYAKRVRRYF
jgi:protein-S-isoprenylcysteine O-methyltransferase Ste14